MNAPTRRPLPVWFLNADGTKAVRQRAKELRDYLQVRRDMRAVQDRRGTR